MILAAILGLPLLFFHVGHRVSMEAAVRSAILSQQNEPGQTSEGQASTQKSSSGKSASAQSDAQGDKNKAQTSTAPSKSPAHRSKKKSAAAKCSNAPVPLNPGGGSAESSMGAKPDAESGTGGANSNALPPCPPRKKVVRNGGSSQPAIQLSGGTSGEKAWQAQSTEELAAATNENLKKIAGKQLNASQQEMVNQIKQFMEQSKAAIAEGDSQRGRTLAAKAHLLSEEVTKP